MREELYAVIASVVESIIIVVLFVVYGLGPPLVSEDVRPTLGDDALLDADLK